MTGQMTRDELDAWLGDAAGEASEDQKEALLRVSEMVAERYPDEDDPSDSEQCFAGAGMVILGDETIEGLRDEWQAARQAADEARARFAGAVMAAVTYHGWSEAALAERLGVARMTVRKALGK